MRGGGTGTVTTVATLVIGVGRDEAERDEHASRSLCVGLPSCAEIQRAFADASSASEPAAST
jgi:hypothetical protein